jgi:hypothetical protein
MRRWKISGFLLSLLAAAGLGCSVYLQKIGRSEPEAIPRQRQATAAAVPALPHVWLVEQKNGTEFYSNGLRIEGGFGRSTAVRAYSAVRHSDSAIIGRTEPAGIVFHTTESQLAPFDAHHNHALKLNASGLLGYVRENALYHFVIDRFGRVFRVVAETDYANHAGHSVWADAEFVYLDLNQPFFGVSFEAQTEAVGSISIAAQVAAARLLTELLRSKYSIPAGNCVTHAQVSVNPRNMQIGYHTDWATRFPFGELGLENGYDAISPAVLFFGFTYSQDLIRLQGGQPWLGLVRSEQQLIQQAAANGKTSDGYRRLLQRKYHTTIAATRRYAPPPRGVLHED